MKDWRELLTQLLDGGELAEAETQALAAALDDEANRREVQGWLRLDAQLWSHLSPAASRDVSVSKERLLAKAALRERHFLKEKARCGRRRKIGFAAAAALLVVAAGAWFVLRSQYPAPQADGQYEVIRNGAVVQDGTPGRGDRLIAGKDGASLRLGGYAELRLEPQTEVIVQGRPKAEVVALEHGALHSTITPGHGAFRVSTPIGTLDVRGTKFVTTVQYSREGGSEMRKAALVTIMVLSGAVAYEFGESVGLLTGGSQMAFGGERREEAPRLPDLAAGFKGMVEGTITWMGDFAFDLKVERIATVWKASKAPKPESLVGATVRIRLTKRSRLYEVHLRTLRSLRKGDRVLVEAFNLEGEELAVIELLRKAGDPTEREGENREREGERKDGDREVDGERRREGERKEGERREGERREGDREVDGERRREGERKEGERREGERKDGERKEGERKEGERKEGVATAEQ
ncbi:FecR domain-containing protein, partial [bacterium]|nr:FecR domain-containing protein [bacterium]